RNDLSLILIQEESNILYRHELLSRSRARNIPRDESERNVPDTPSHRTALDPWDWPTYDARKLSFEIPSGNWNGLLIQ
ncbi:hypothetical protein GJ744_003982, partial [Endocarpon pusillum]